MDGLIMNQFQRFVVSRFGREAWPALIEAAGVPLGNDLLPVSSTYPDDYLFSLVPAAANATGVAASDLLEQFGKFIGPTLLRVYAPLISPHWRTLDVVENTEAAIHRVVRQRRPDASPPELRVTRISADEVAIDYRSPRRLCEVAVGIVAGMAEHFAENVTMDQIECMHRRDPRCFIMVRLHPANGSPPR